MPVLVTPRNPSFPPFTVQTAMSITLVDGGTVQLNDASGNIVALLAQSDNDIVVQ